MVWNAATLWAETSEGKDRSAWQQHLEAHRSRSAVEPQKNLRRFLSPERQKLLPLETKVDTAAQERIKRLESIQRSRRVSPKRRTLKRGKKRSSTAPLLEEKMRQRTPSPLDGGRKTPGSPPSRGQSRDDRRGDGAVSPTFMISDGGTGNMVDGDELEDDLDAYEEEDFLSGEEDLLPLELSDGEGDRTSGTGNGNGELSSTLSPSQIATALRRTSPPRGEREETAEEEKYLVLPALVKRTPSEISTLRRVRITTLRKERIDTIHQRNTEHQEHTLDVQRRADEHAAKKVAAAALSLERKRRRLLDPIERCETEEERNELRALTYFVLFPHVQLAHRAKAIINEQKATSKLRLLFLPLLHLKLRKKVRVAAAYASMWVGKLRRPSPEAMQELLPPLLFWPIHIVQRLLRKLRPRKLNAGEILAHEGEPCNVTYLVQSGCVSIRQRIGSAKSKSRITTREIGDRRGRAVFGEDAIMKTYRTKHMANLHCIEPTLLWELARSDYVGAQITLPAAATFDPQHGKAYMHRPSLAVSGSSFSPSRTVTFADGEQKGEEENGGEEDSDELVPTRSSAALDGTVVIQGQVMVPLQPLQVRDNRCFSFWSLEELAQLLSLCEYKQYPRGSTIYDIGESSSHLYIVWKGTVEVAVATGVNALKNMKDRVDSIRLRRTGSTGTEGTKSGPTATSDQTGTQATTGGLMMTTTDGSSGQQQRSSLLDSRFPQSMAQSATSPTELSVTAKAFAEEGFEENTMSASLGGGLHRSSSSVDPGHLRSFRKKVATDDKAFVPTVGRKFANVGQSFGEEAILFRMKHEGTAKAATDVLCYLVPPTPFIDGCLSNPSAFYELMCTLNVQRAHRLQRLPAAVYQELLAPSVINTFSKSCTATVAMKGEQLPVSTAVIFVSQGTVSLNGLPYEAPCVVAHPDAFDNNMDVYQSAYSEVTAQLGTSTAQKQAIQSAIEAKQKAVELPRVNARTRCLTRVDYWSCDFALLLRKLPKVTKLSEMVVPAASPGGKGTAGVGVGLKKKESSKFGQKFRDLIHSQQEAQRKAVLQQQMMMEIS